MSYQEKTADFEKIYLDANNQLFAGIMSNGKKYTIPRFQRDYTWESSHWEELWHDIEEMRTNRVQHFMGYLVFQAQNGKTFAIIDGQQRLTTLSILITTALKQLKELVDNKIEAKENRARIASYQKTYIDVFDPVALTTEAKLVLNRHNKAHFRAITKSFDLTKQRNIATTNRKLDQSFRFFAQKLQPYKSGAAIASFISDLADGLLFTTITVQNDLNAYTVFETLNARGVHLSTPDLLKNYLLSTMANDGAFLEQDFLDFEDQWAGILAQLGETEFTSFLRSYRGIKNKLINKKDLFRALKKDVNSSIAVLPYLKDLQKFSAVFAALQNHNDSFWKEDEGQYGEVCAPLETLNLFNIKTPLTILMAGYDKLSPKDFITLLKRIVVITIRYNIICNKPVKEQEEIYNKMANNLTNTDIALYDLTNMLRPIYPDGEFLAAFTAKTIPNRHSNKRILFLLTKIEQQLGGNEPILTTTLEHIFPFSPDDKWQKYFGRAADNNAMHRLGNMALLAAKQNMGQESFVEKREVLQNSPCKINQHIAEYNEWNMDSLNEHQKWLAKQAKTVWKISQLENP